LQVGEDGLLARAQMIDAAERTLDLQYYIFRGDNTGLLICEALLRAADRGVRVRVLVDDAERAPGDEQIDFLDGHPNIEVRIFNPFAYRGTSRAARALEFLFNESRLDYRMHNKLFVVDNAIALIGGRNIGDEYFQIDPESQYADDDLFAAGPIVMQLSTSFDEYWNSTLAIPVRALRGGVYTRSELDAYRKRLIGHREQLAATGVDYISRIAGGQPLQGMVSERHPLIWTTAELVYDSPYKKAVESGEIPGQLMFPRVLEAAATVESELLIVAPFFVPGPDGMQFFDELRKRNMRVRILTNSLESTPEPIAHAGYVHYRRPLLEQGVELYELRSRLGSTRGSGERRWLLSYGTYGLHAKLFVMDRTRVLIGSVNFDLRSEHLNTEIALIPDSKELAEQTAARFQALVQPANSYQVLLRKNDDGTARLVWTTQDDGKLLSYDHEPSRNEERRLELDFFRILPIDGEL
jgi:putative cardiolipin synthase